jgi:hypothetical protein
MTTEYVQLKIEFRVGATLQIAGFPPSASLADDIVIDGVHTGVPVYLEHFSGGRNIGYWYTQAINETTAPQNTNLIQTLNPPEAGGMPLTAPVWIKVDVPGTAPPSPPPPAPSPPIIMTVERVTADTSVVSAGNTAHFSWQLDNFNSTQATNSVGIYLSRDPTIDASDNLISSYTATLPANHATYYSNIPITIPGNVAPGNYYMGLLIDFESPSQSHASAGVPVTILHAQTGVNPVPNLSTTADMILRQSSTGNFEIYNLGNNAIQAAYPLGAVGLDWQFAGVGNFNGDTTDMLLRNSTTGGFEVYDVSYNNITTAAFMGTVGLDWKTGGFGDFNGDGYTDMMLRNANTGGLEAYNIAHNAIIGAAFMGTVGLDWKIAGFGDFYNHGHDDMIMRNANSGGLYAYDISGNRINSASYMGVVGTNWQTLGFGNFSGRGGNGDMVMRNTNTGGLEVYDINHGQITGAAFMGTVGLDWQFAGIAPVHGANESDLVLRNATTGQFEVYDIQNNALVGAAPLGAVGTDWQVDALTPNPAAFSGAGGAGGSSLSSQSVNLLTQAMSSFGASGSSGDLGAVAPQETSQQTVLTTPQHA